MNSRPELSCPGSLDVPHIFPRSSLDFPQREDLHFAKDWPTEREVAGGRSDQAGKGRCAGGERPVCGAQPSG
jgi:hypothetical protein